MNVLIITTAGFRTLPVLRCLSGIGASVYIMSISKAYAIRFSRHCRELIQIDKKQLEDTSDELIKKIEEYSRYKSIEIIIPAGLEATIFLSKIKHRLKQFLLFPAAHYETIERLNNKWTFYEFLSANKIPTPETNLVKEMNDVFSLDIEYPVLGKPVDGAGGRGIKVLNSTDELIHYTRDVFSKRYRSFIVQEYISRGYDIDLSVLCRNGEIIAWTIQRRRDDGFIEFLENNEVLSIGERIARLTSFTGVAHFDMRFDEKDGRIKVLECNPRFWDSLLASKWAGVNFPYIGIRVAKGEPLVSDIKYKQIRYMDPFKLLKNLLLFKIPFGNIETVNMRSLIDALLDPVAELMCTPFFQDLQKKILRIPLFCRSKIIGDSRILRF